MTTMLLPALLLCFILLLLVAVYYRPPKSWDEIEAEDRKRATEKGMEHTAWVEARARKKHAVFQRLLGVKSLLATTTVVCNVVQLRNSLTIFSPSL